MPSPSPLSHDRISALTSLRGIAAVCIVLFHYGVNGFDRPTWLGVSMFFILSGFLLAKRHRSIECRQWRRFALPRLARIYSIHWTTLAILALIHIATASGATLQWLAPHLLLVQAWLPWHEAVYAHNSVAWFLSALVVCYMAFPLLWQLVKRMPQWQLAALVALLAAVQAIIINCAGGEIAYTHPLSRLQDFVLGMVLGRLSLDAKPSCKTSATIRQVAAVALTAIVIMADNAFPTAFEGYDATLLWWPSAAALVWAFSCAEGTGVRLHGFRPLVWLGGISLEIYLLQNHAALVWNNFAAPVAAHFGFTGAYDHYALPSLVLLIVAARAAHRWITAPMWSAINRRFNRQPLTAAKP